MRLIRPMEITENPPPDDRTVPLQQHPAFARALAAMGRPALTLRIAAGSRTLGHVTLMQRGKLALASRGPVWEQGSEPSERAAALRALRRRIGWALALNADAPDPALPRARFLPLLTPATIAEWDLGPDPDTRRARLGQKWRNRLVRAEDQGWKVRRIPFPADPGHWLLARDAEQQRAKRYRALPGALSAAYAAVNKGQAWLFQAEDRGGPAAAALILLHGPVATWHIGWSDTRGRAGHAQALLLWQAADWLAARGVHRLDLGTIDTVSAPGLARFKLGTGAAARPLGGTWGALGLY